MSETATTPRKTNNQLLQENDTAGAVVLQIIIILEKILSFVIARRLVAMLYIQADVPVERICILTGLHEDTVYALRKRMKSNSPESLLSITEGRGRRRILSGVKEAIKDELGSNNYCSRRHIASMIFKKFGIKISLSALSENLKNLSFKKLMCGSLPGKGSLQKQKAFYETKLLPFMRAAADGSMVLLFLDGSHFVMGCDFLGSVWCTARRFISTASGRKRYNVLGAIDYVTKKVFTVTNDKYIKAVSVCELLRKIAAAYPGQVVHIILDNARYQKCKAVTDLAEELGIHLDYIPSYSPNLNLIERLWKFVKSELRTDFFESFELFKRRIDEIIVSTSGENKERIDRLISSNFQFYTLRPVAKNTFEEA